MSSQPDLLYAQIEHNLRQRIISGDLSIGEKIPTEIELCEKYSVSRITVRRAIQNLVDEGILSLPRLVQLMCHNPAILFGVSKRGFLRQGYKADLVVVRPHVAWTVTPSVIQSKCGWSPLEGRCFDWRVEHTFCNGHHVLDDGRFDDTSRGEQVLFRC